MITRGARRRFSSVALALLATLLIFGIAAPIIVSVSSNRITVGSSTLVAAPRDSVIISGPTALGGTKTVTVERGLLYPADAAGKALDRPLSRAQLAGGNTRFMIENGIFRIGEMPAEVGGDTTSPLIDAISGLAFDVVSMRKSTVLVALPDGRTESISEIDAEVTHRRKASLAIKGQGELRGQRVTFEVSAGLPSEARPGPAAPLKISFKSALAEVSFDGKAGFTGAVQMQGALDFKLPNIRQIARWFGSPWPTGNGLRNVQGNAQLDWTGPAMALNRAALLIDGNEATGTLNMNFAGQRPTFGGTLALKSLDLGRYFANVTLALPGSIDGVWSRVRATDFTLPLIQHVDADLRISADKVVLGTVQLGRSAAAVTVAQGKMLADVGAFEFDGGKGSGQVSADMSGTVPKFTVRGRMDEVDAQRISNSLIGHALLSGKATVTTDISAHGRIGDDLLISASGKLNIGMRNSGRLGVDLTSLSAVTARRAVDGWGSSGRGSMSFDEFNGAFSVRSGALLAEDVTAQSGEIATSLTGLIDVPTGRLNVSIVQLPITTRAGSPTAGITPNLSLQVFGPWRLPTIRNDAGRERAADPSGPATTSPARL